MDQNPESTTDYSEDLCPHLDNQSKSCFENPDSHTAAEFINSQLQLEAEAREALPYKFENCTKPLGKLRQSIFSCLTCNPIPDNRSDPYQAAGICYSCSIQCHGNHRLVELFQKRDFECDCGTTRFPATSPCNLRINPTTNERGGVHSEKHSTTNKYNQNFQNRFCGCQCDYDPETQKGTMFQCLGLGSIETGGCGEDWWHACCIVGLEPDWYLRQNNRDSLSTSSCLKNYTSPSQIAHRHEFGDEDSSVRDLSAHYEDNDPPYPPGFPSEDDFDGFICYKCVDANPWIKRYAGTPGFLPAVLRQASPSNSTEITAGETKFHNLNKRKHDHFAAEPPTTVPKKAKNGLESSDVPTEIFNDLSTKNEDSVDTRSRCRLGELPQSHQGQISLFYQEDFRLHLCHCNDCYPKIQNLPQLLEAEDSYEPSISTDFCEEPNSTVGSSSLYERGESVLKNIDRVRAIEGIMAYNHLKDKLKPFFQQFAESGKAISAEDIKAHFAKIRGDELNVTEPNGESQISNNFDENRDY